MLPASQNGFSKHAAAGGLTHAVSSFGWPSPPTSETVAPSRARTPRMAIVRVTGSHCAKGDGQATVYASPASSMITRHSSSTARRPVCRACSDPCPPARYMGTLMLAWRVGPMLGGGSAQPMRTVPRMPTRATLTLDAMSWRQDILRISRRRARRCQARPTESKTRPDQQTKAGQGLFAPECASYIATSASSGASAEPLPATAAGASDAGRPSGPASATVCASLAYSFLPRPESISSEPMTTSVFQCRTRQSQD
jgi:hypothetical protein